MHDNDVIKRERVRGGSKRFNTCMSDGLTPDCVFAVPFRPFYSSREKVKIFLYAVIGYFSLQQNKKEKHRKKRTFGIRTFIFPRAPADDNHLTSNELWFRSG
jgi:hypothetical protein